MALLTSKGYLTMRLWIAALLIGATALPIAACNRQAAEEEAAKPAVVETPVRKAGLWKQTTSVPGMGSIPAVGICLDAAADKKLAWWAQQGLRGNCDQNEISKAADGSWTFSSVCQSPEGIRTATKGTATGDFQSAYQVKAESTTSGAPLPDMNGTRNVTIDAVWSGDCPSNMKPGDMQLPDGNLVNLIELTGG
jgi:hypothetical protein